MVVDVALSPNNSRGLLGQNPRLPHVNVILHIHPLPPLTDPGAEKYKPSSSHKNYAGRLPQNSFCGLGKEGLQNDAVRQQVSESAGEMMGRSAG